MKPYKIHNDALLKRLRALLGELPRGWKATLAWDYAYNDRLPALSISAQRTVKRKRRIEISGARRARGDWELSVAHVEVANDPSYSRGAIEMLGSGAALADELHHLAAVVERIERLRYPARAPLPGPRPIVRHRNPC